MSMQAANLVRRLTGAALIGIAAAMFHAWDVLMPIEDWVQGWFMAGPRFGGEEFPRVFQFMIILAVGMMPVLIKIDHPLGLIAYSLGLGFVFLLVYSVLLLTLDVTLPATAPLLALGAAALLQGSLTWMDERSNRRRLEAVEAARQQFTDMLVHDLKRRMSSILMSLSVLEDSGSHAAGQRDTLTATIRASAERMLLLTGNLLDIRKLDGSCMVLRREPVDVGELVRICLREHRGACELGNVTVSVSGPKGVMANADRAVLLRILANLFWNALQYAPEGSTVEMGWSGPVNGLVSLYVANRGPVISPDDCERVFRAFIADEIVPENSLVANTGLGLTFCKLATDAHGGSIKLVSPWPGFDEGVRVELTLPATS